MHGVPLCKEQREAVCSTEGIMGRCGGSSLQGGTHFSSFAMVAPLLEEPYTTVVDASPWAEGGDRGWGRRGGGEEGGGMVAGMYNEINHG